MRARGEQDQPCGGGAAPRLERLPALMAHDVHLIEIVHAGPPEGAVGGGKARRFDDMRFDAETGGQTKNGPRVLGNIGLEQRNAQVWGQASSRSGRPSSERPRRREESALPRPGIPPGERVRRMPAPAGATGRVRVENLRTAKKLCDFWSLRCRPAPSPLALPWQGCQ